MLNRTVDESDLMLGNEASKETGLDTSQNCGTANVNLEHPSYSSPKVEGFLHPSQHDPPKYPPYSPTCPPKSVSPVMKCYFGNCDTVTTEGTKYNT